MIPYGWNPKLRNRYIFTDIQNRLRFKLDIEEVYQFQLDYIDKTWNYHRDILINMDMGSGKISYFLGITMMEEESMILIISPLKEFIYNQIYYYHG